MNDNLKKTYTKPELQMKGSVEAITLEQNKRLGPSDGLLLNGNAIANAS